MHICGFSTQPICKLSHGQQTWTILYNSVQIIIIVALNNSAQLQVQFSSNRYLLVDGSSKSDLY